MAEPKQAAKAAHKPEEAKDFAGNPVGTTYNPNGKAQPSDMGFNDLPQNAEGTIQYNEDGSVFEIPADSEEVMGKIRHDIAGVNLAIGNHKNSFDVFRAHLAVAEADEAPIFEKRVANIEVAIKSSEDLKAALEEKLAAYKLSLVTPAQRHVEKEIIEIVKKIAPLQARLIELENMKKAWNVSPIKTAPSGGGKKGTEPQGIEGATEEQKKNLKEAIAATKGGTQGEAIVELVKAGKKNAEIANFLGISQANVPGPKNKWLRETVEGGKYEVCADGVTRLKA